MKVICMISHEQPGDAPGKFTIYEAGREYELDDPEPGLFRTVHGMAEGMEQRAESKDKKKK